jgi:adenine-specific DNA-methyltransferase
VDENDELIDGVAEAEGAYGEKQDFPSMILENLKMAGVQQAHKEDKIDFSSLTPWPGDLVCAEGRYMEGDEEAGNEKRAAVFIGPEFGTVTRPDLVAAAREAGDADFDVLIACAFNYAKEANADMVGKVTKFDNRVTLMTTKQKEAEADIKFVFQTEMIDMPIPDDKKHQVPALIPDTDPIEVLAAAFSQPKFILSVLDAEGYMTREQLKEQFLTDQEKQYVNGRKEQRCGVRLSGWLRWRRI